MGRWERLGMTAVVAAAVIIAALTVLGGRSVPTGDVVTVRPGDTVGTIVLRELPDMDPVRAMELVEAMNGLSDSVVPVGATLRLPAGGAATGS